MVMNEYLDKKLRVLNMHEKNQKSVQWVTDQQKINVRFKFTKRQGDLYE